MNPASSIARPIPTDRLLTVSQLNRLAREFMESAFPLLWIEGELSNLSRPSSGHIYFTLKDQHAQVRCALFRNRARWVRAPMKDGDRVRLRARVGIYEGRGEFQLLVEQLEVSGDGALRAAFEALRERLSAEGVFERARPLPLLPRGIGVITSPNAAALHDVLSVLGRRFPALPVWIYPSAVQGRDALGQLMQALKRAVDHNRSDLLLLVRGGGSLEDLQPFNEERLARTLFACPLPVVVGVGHEVDVTIADYAADRRAPTPSAAAELAVPDGAEWTARYRRFEQQLQLVVRRRLEQSRQRLHAQQRMLARLGPQARIRQWQQRLDGLEQRQQRAIEALLARRTHRLALVNAALLRYSPQNRLALQRNRQEQLQRRLVEAMNRRLDRARARFGTLARALGSVSPLTILARGYAVVSDRSGRVVRDAREVAPESQVEARLAHGRLICRVERIDLKQDE